MGIIKAALGAVSGGLADTWLEVIEPDRMDDNTAFAPGVLVTQNGRSQNKKGSKNIVSNGSIIHVYDNQFMLLLDGGKVVDYTAEPGYYKVDNSSMPSLFNGQFGDSLKETFSRIKYGGIPSQSQKVCFINLQELKGIKFGTANPVNYFDAFYNSELFIRAHGTYSIKITEPLKFYAEAIPRSAVTDDEPVNINSINSQYLDEFLAALTSSINQMSADGIRISYVASKSRELGKYMSQTLDEEWNEARGMQIQSVGMASVSYDEKSQELINMRNQGAMLSDANIQAGYVAGSVARGMEAAGSNESGSMNAFMGMGMGMNMGANMLGGYQANQAAQQQAQQNQQAQQAQQAQTVQSQDSWKCSCGAVCTGKFCTECGSKKPETIKRFCTECGHEVAQDAKFCPNCGNKL